MSIRPTELKESTYESEYSDMSESEQKKEEVKKNYLFIILFIAIDYIITICVILHESHLFKLDDEKNKEELNLIYLIINASCLTVFFLFIIISLLFYRVCLSKTIKYLYVIILGAYFIFLLVMKIIHFVNNFESLNILDIVFLILLLASIVPRLFFFCYIDAYIIALIEKYECQRGEEHEDLKQKLEERMGSRDNRDNTNWSKTSLTNEPKRTSD